MPAGVGDRRHEVVPVAAAAEHGDPPPERPPAHARVLADRRERGRVADEDARPLPDEVVETPVARTAADGALREELAGGAVAISDQACRQAGKLKLLRLAW